VHLAKTSKPIPGVKIQQVISSLLERAAPSIQYRLRHEVLGESLNSPQMRKLQRQILDDPLVKKIFRWRRADGWLADDFHGSQSLEAGVRILCEKGVSPGHNIIKGALSALTKNPERIARGIGKVGSLLDKAGLGGSLLIRAVVYAYAGVEGKVFIHKEVEKALQVFSLTKEVRSIEEISRIHNEKRVFKTGAVWPSLYHLRLLAYTQNWRSQKNLETMSAAVRNLVALSPIPQIRFLHKSQLVSPASFAMDDFNPVLTWLTPAKWMAFFHRMDLLSRLGIISHVPQLADQVDGLQKMLFRSNGFFTKSLSHPFFHNWGAYTGLALEADWKSPLRRVNDLTFRSLVIISRSE
jgi:hypothetical protein